MQTEKTALQFGVSYCPYAKSADVEMSRWEAAACTAFSQLEPRHATLAALAGEE